MHPLALLKIPVKTEGIRAPFSAQKNIRLNMLRLDDIDGTISGNKLFKLKYFLEEAVRSDHKRIVTFGGPYSNHLAATAAACKQLDLKCIGVVRGEESKAESETLKNCIKDGMEVNYVTRSAFTVMCEDANAGLEQRFGPHIFVPMGGYGITGMRGAAEIASLIPEKTYTHICCSVGTATTVAGLLSRNRQEKIIGFAPFKNFTDLQDRFTHFGIENSVNFRLVTDYHFGGFGKINDDLISFMNEFYLNNKIKLDIIYTGKMISGIFDMIKKGFFSDGSNILAIHTGGLQGNCSLPSNTLNFL